MSSEHPSTIPDGKANGTIRSWARGAGDSLVLMVLMPGWSQLRWGETARGRILAGGVISGWLAAILVWGAVWSSVSLAFAIGIHLYAATDTLRRHAFPGWNGRVALGGASFSLCLLYGPALAAAQSRIYPAWEWDSGRSFPALRRVTDPDANATGGLCWAVDRGAYAEPDPDPSAGEVVAAVPLRGDWVVVRADALDAPIADARAHALGERTASALASARHADADADARSGSPGTVLQRRHCLARVAAVEGEAVEWLGAHVWVENQRLDWWPTQPASPNHPERMVFRVPPGYLAVVLQNPRPSHRSNAPRNRPLSGALPDPVSHPTPDDSEPSELRLVPRGKVVGRAWAILYPVWERRLLSRTDPPRSPPAP